LAIAVSILPVGSSACAALVLDGRPITQDTALSDASVLPEDRRDDVLRNLVWIVAQKPDILTGQTPQPDADLLSSVAGHPAAAEAYLSSQFATWEAYSESAQDIETVHVLYVANPDRWQDNPDANGISDWTGCISLVFSPVETTQGGLRLPETAQREPIDQQIAPGLREGTMSLFGAPDSANVYLYFKASIDPGLTRRARGAGPDFVFFTDISLIER
jgi:hypothetical protein